MIRTTQLAQTIHRGITLAVVLAVVVSTASCVPVPGAEVAPAAARDLVERDEAITARMLTAPGALVGPGPSGFLWSPTGATLTYVEPQDGQNVLWLAGATAQQQLGQPAILNVTGSQRPARGDATGADDQQ